MTLDWRLRRAAELLRTGAIIAHPTEAVIGLAACAFDGAACTRMRTLKRRPRAKPFIVVAATLEQLRPLIGLDLPRRQEVLKTWPGPHTWVVPATQSAPAWLTAKTGYIAVRVTAHPQMVALCLAAGPIVSTSANPAGRPPARTLFAARRYFGRAVNCYLNGPLGDALRPTDIRDASTGELLRA